MAKNIAFAYYKDDRLVGFYSDSFGTISDYPKIYPGTLDQVDVIVRNIIFSIRCAQHPEIENIGDILNSEVVSSTLTMFYEKIQDLRSFELLIYPCVAYGEETNWVYPEEDIEDWKRNLPNPILVLKFNR